MAKENTIDKSGYMQIAKSGIDILGDFMYDTNDYAQNFNYQPVQPGIGNRDAILNNNIHYEYQPIQNIGAGEYLGDTLSNGLSVGLTTGNVWAGLGASALTLIGKAVKQGKINSQNSLGYALVDSVNKQQNAINNYALEQTDRYNNFLQQRHMIEDGGLLHTHGGTFDNGLTYFNVGGTHGQNPYGGILQGFNEEDGKPNLVEQGETKWNDYIFSNRYKAGGSLLKKYILPEEYAGMTFADISKKLSESLEDTPGSMIEKRTTDTMLSRLMEAQEEKRAKDAENKINGYMFAKGGKEKRTPLETIQINPRTIDQLDNPYNQEIDYLPSILVSQYIEPYDNSQDFIGPETEGEWLYNNPEKSKFNFNPRYLTLFDNFASVLGDKLGITNQPDYGRSRMYRDAANNIRNVGVTAPYIQEYIPKEIPIAALTNDYRSQYAGNAARIMDSLNGNTTAALAGLIANNNRYQKDLGDLYINMLMNNNTELARAAELNNASRMQKASLLQNNSQFNAQQGNRRYEALKDYINDLTVQDQLASAAQQGNLNTWREGLQNYLMEHEDKDVIAQLIKSGALKYDKNAGAYYLSKYFG